MEQCGQNPKQNRKSGKVLMLDISVEVVIDSLGNRTHTIYHWSK